MEGLRGGGQRSNRWLFVLSPPLPLAKVGFPPWTSPSVDSRATAQRPTTIKLPLLDRLKFLVPLNQQDHHVIQSWLHRAVDVLYIGVHLPSFKAKVHNTILCIAHMPLELTYFFVYYQAGAVTTVSHISDLSCHLKVVLVVELQSCSSRQARMWRW